MGCTNMTFHFTSPARFNVWRGGGGGRRGRLCIVQYLYLFNFARIFAMFTAMHVRNISCPCVHGAKQSLEMALRGKDVAGIQLAC
jgi:hypothetical protein